jgi:hypothetical protein
MPKPVVRIIVSYDRKGEKRGEAYGFGRRNFARKEVDGRNRLREGVERESAKSNTTREREIWCRGLT